MSLRKATSQSNTTSPPQSKLTVTQCESLYQNRYDPLSFSKLDFKDSYKQLTWHCAKMALDFDEQSIQEILALTEENEPEKFGGCTDLLSCSLSASELDLDPIAVNSSDFSFYEPGTETMRLGTPPAEALPLSSVQVSMSPKPEPSASSANVQVTGNDDNKKQVPDNVETSQKLSVPVARKPLAFSSGSSGTKMAIKASAIAQPVRRKEISNGNFPQFKKGDQSKAPCANANARPRCPKPSSGTAVAGAKKMNTSQKMNASQPPAASRSTKRKLTPSNPLSKVKEEPGTAKVQGRKLSIDQKFPPSLPSVPPQFLPLVMGSGFPNFPGLPAVPIPRKGSQVQAKGTKATNVAPMFPSAMNADGTANRSNASAPPIFFPNPLTSLDPAECKRQKKQKRLIRNRISAQLHRERKKRHVGELEQQVEVLKNENKKLAKRVEELESKNKELATELASTKRQSKDMSSSMDDLLDLSMLGDEYLSSPVPGDSDHEEFSRVHERFMAASHVPSSPGSTSAEESPHAVNGYQPWSGKAKSSHLDAVVDASQTRKRISGTSSKQQKKRKIAGRPAAAALCLAAVMLTISVFGTDTPLLGGPSSPNQAKGPSQGVPSLNNVMANRRLSEGQQSTHKPLPIPVNMKLPSLPKSDPPSLPVQVYKNQKPAARPQGGGPIGKQLLALSDTSSGERQEEQKKQLLALSDTSSGERQEEQKKEGDRKRPTEAALAALSGKLNPHRDDLAHVMLQQAIANRLQPFMEKAEDGVRASSDLASALYHEVITVSKYLPAPPAKEQPLEPENATQQKSLAVYNSKGQFKSPESETVQKEAVDAAVRAYLAHVGANVEYIANRPTKVGDSVIMCPQAYGILSKGFEGQTTAKGESQSDEPSSKRAKVDPEGVLENEERTGNNLRGKLLSSSVRSGSSVLHQLPSSSVGASGNTNSTQSMPNNGEGGDHFHQRGIQEPYLTLFVPSDSIHAPQWGLDGKSGGFVQLGCKLDTIRPLFSPRSRESDDSGFRVVE